MRRGESDDRGDDHGFDPERAFMCVDRDRRVYFRPPPESDFLQTKQSLAGDAGASFFPRTFSLSELSVDLRDGGDGDLPAFAVHEEDAIGQIGLKRNFSDLSDL